MNKALDESLTKSFPLLFADRYGDIRQTALCWGIECGDGWYEVLAKASCQLEPLIEEYVRQYPYRNEFPSWVFSRYNMRISCQGRCYSLMAIWEWILIGLRLRKPAPWWPRVSQIKEKYGTLRLSLTSGTEEMYAIADAAEEASAKTCEQCGKPGKLRGRLWVYTACKKHTEKADR